MSTNEETQDRQGRGRGEGTVNAVVKALHVLECFSASQGRLTLAQISHRLSLPKSTALNLIRTLEQAGYLLRGGDQTYQLGYKTLELSYCLRATMPVVQYTIPFMEELQIQTGETIYLTSHVNGRVLYLEAMYPSIRIGNYSITGKTLPMHCTGCGKAMMAYLPEDELERVLAHNPLVRCTPNTITDPDKLREELANIRRRGYATDVEEETPGAKCVGVSIRDNTGYPVAALSVSGTVMSVRDDKLDNYARMLDRVSHVLAGNASQFPAAQMREKQR